MIDYVELIRLFIFALLIGIFVGVEREYAKRKFKTDYYRRS